MRRGDVVIALLKGDYGKPRPVVVVQADRYAAHTSVTVAMMSSTLSEFTDIRIDVEPTASNGLREPSQVLTDRVQTVPKTRLRDIVGRLSDADMVRVDRGLALFLGFA